MLPEEDRLFLDVIKGLSEYPQLSMTQFPERTAFLNAVRRDGNEKRCLSHFVSGLCAEYNVMLTEFSGFPTSARYTEMQVQWLQRVRQIVEAGETLAIAEAQDSDADSDKRYAELATHVASLAMGAFGDSTVSSSTLLAVFHSVARQVFLYQKAKVVATKQTDTEAEEQDLSVCILYKDSEDSLYRVCGAQLHRMLAVRTEKAGSDHQVQREVDFLRQISMNSDDKKKHVYQCHSKVL